MRQPHAVHVVVPASRLSRVVRDLHDASGVTPLRMLCDYIFLPPVSGFGKFASASLMEVEGAQTLVVDGVLLLGVPLNHITGYFGWHPLPDVRVELEPFGRSVTATLSWLSPNGDGPVPGWDKVRCMRLLEFLFRHGRMVGGMNVTDEVMQLRAATESEPTSGELRY